MKKTRFRIKAPPESVRPVPFFLGLVLGHAIIAAFWTLVSLVTGTPGVQMPPN